MSIVTKSDFQRLHNNGSVLVNVPAGTQLQIEVLYAVGFWKVTAEQPVTRYGEKAFHINSKEYSQLMGVLKNGSK